MFAVNCWPNDSGNSCEVNVEYELLNVNLELREVQIEIPIPSNAGAPVVSEIDGNHQFESRRGSLFWRLEVIDQHNSTGTLVFTTGSANTSSFFPIRVNFYSPKIISDISVRVIRIFLSSNLAQFVLVAGFCCFQIDRVVQPQDSSNVKFSSESSLVVERYEIV